MVATILLILALVLCWPHIRACENKGLKCIAERIWNGDEK